jgi:enoyl-CoA hydratase/carnithine racemase
LTGGDLVIEREGRVLTVVFNRPAQRNAFTWEMYDGLIEACQVVEHDDSVRVLVLRGSGERAFAAGTDIGQFAEFHGADGIAYERRVTRVLDRLADVAVPTVAAIRGACVGAGLLVASACDIRIATRSAVFGAPIARTVGNCLSMQSHATLVLHFGPARVLDMLLRGHLISAEAAYTAGFVAEPCADDRFDEALAGAIDDLLAGAPLTQWATKEALRRLRQTPLPADVDILSRVYGSRDFREGVRAFSARESPRWTGQ